MSDYRKYGSSRANYIVIEDPSVCYVCKAHVPADAVECPACHFPQNGDDGAQRWFLGQLRAEKLEKQMAAGRITRTFRYLLSLPIVLGLLTAGFYHDNEITLAQISGLLAFIFLGIWFWGRRRPLRAFITTFILYAIVSLPLMIIEPVIILRTKFFIIAPYIFLLIGAYSVHTWQQLDDELKDKNTG